MKKNTQKSGRPGSQKAGPNQPPGKQVPQTTKSNKSSKAAGQVNAKKQPSLKKKQSQKSDNRARKEYETSHIEQ